LIVQNDVGIVGQGGMRRQNSSGKRHAPKCSGYPYNDWHFPKAPPRQN
jgi:hypothetical protein